MTGLAAQIYEGSNEVQKIVVARELVQRMRKALSDLDREDPAEVPL